MSTSQLNCVDVSVAPSTSNSESLAATRRAAGGPELGASLAFASRARTHSAKEAMLSGSQVYTTEMQPELLFAIFLSAVKIEAPVPRSTMDAEKFDE